MRNKRGSTLTELIIVMAVVAIMSVMVISFTTIVSGWSSLGTERVNTAQSAELLSSLFHNFVSEYDNSMYRFTASSSTETDTVDEETVTYNIYTLDVINIADSSNVSVFRYEEKDNSITITEDDASRTIALSGVTVKGFGIIQNSEVSQKSILITADVDYVYVTPGRANPEENRSYKLVAALRSGQ
ncbi:MAG: prepilin-type N-terminal cleavage/methylation domain-containing protein [Clostridia bacterium]|nr:prepilin-type N-terminal cleavage/methylation domain-containing protein [Clostridia bacterium]